MELPGIQFIVNRDGEKTAVVIDLKEHGELWEDFYDGVIAETQKGQPSVPIEELRRDLGFGAKTSDV